MNGFIDLHCHLLPGVDDGPADTTSALTLARALVADGVSTVAATPHRTLRLPLRGAEIAERTAALAELLHAEGVPLRVLPGAEVSVEAVLDLDAAEIDALRIGADGPLLVELPQREVARDPLWPVHDLLDAGVPVLLAHPERIPFLQADPARLAPLVERGVHAQLTSGALLGDYGPVAHITALAMLGDGMADVLASDAHHADRRPPRTADALRWLASAHPGVDGASLAVHTPGMLIAPQAPRG